MTKLTLTSDERSESLVTSSEASVKHTEGDTGTVANDEKLPEHGSSELVSGRTVLKETESSVRLEEEGEGEREEREEGEGEGEGERGEGEGERGDGWDDAEWSLPDDDENVEDRDKSPPDMNAAQQTKRVSYYIQYI